MLTEKEQFRLGFLARCAEERLDAEEIDGRVKLAFSLGDIGRLFASYPLYMGVGGLGAAAVGGAGLGYMGAKATEEDVDPEMAKKYELIAAYQQQAERARRSANRIAHRERPPQVRGPRLF